MSIFKATAATMIAIGLAGCGFKPIYATPTGVNAALSQQIVVRSVNASESILPVITQALKERIAIKDGITPKYDLYVETRERAARLAVQIDATVTRYNYQLSANYTLIELKTGVQTKGNARAVTSYNIVNSQYSTLYAERNAQEKAARVLASEIERDLLLRFADNEFGQAEPEEVLVFTLDPEEDNLLEGDRAGDVPDPFESQPTIVTSTDPTASDVPDPITEE